MTAFRCRPIADPGSLLKGNTPAKPKSLDMGRAPRETDAKHLALIRQCSCLVCGIETGIEAAHVRYSSARDGKANPGIGRRPSDGFTVPLCAPHHREQHTNGEELWWTALGIDPITTALALYAASPDLDKMRAIVVRKRMGQ